MQDIKQGQSSSPLQYFSAVHAIIDRWMLPSRMGVEQNQVHAYC